MDRSQIFLKHYERQIGGGFPVFRGSDVQYGGGLGQILRSVGRFLLPIFAPVAASAATNFVKSAADNLSSGRSFGDSAKQSLRSTLATAVGDLGDNIKTRIQSGHGRRKRKRKSTPGKKRVYKKRAKSTKRRSSKKRARKSNF